MRLTGGFRILSQLSLPITQLNCLFLYSAYEVCALFPGDSDDEIEMEVVNEENKEEESLYVEILDVCRGR